MAIQGAAPELVPGYPAAAPRASLAQAAGGWGIRYLRVWVFHCA